MNHLYEAVMILGRAVEDVRKYGWACEEIGRTSGEPKCANGALALGAGFWKPEYISEVAEARPELETPLRLAGLALLRSAPASLLRLLDQEYGGSYSRMLQKPDDEWPIKSIENMIVTFNDHQVTTDEIDEEGDHVCLPYFFTKTAIAWFEAAFEKICKELPEPLLFVPAEFARDAEPQQITV